MSSSIHIRKATTDDHNSIWEIIEPVIRTGDTYAFAPDTSKDEMMAFWCGPERHTYVAELDGTIQGTFLLKANQPGLGNHVANAAYMTHPQAAGRGIGRAMGEFSIKEAKRLGYLAMQFNIVIKSNERAVALWKKLGFKIIGEIPDAFRHSKQGLTNAYIMWRSI